MLPACAFLANKMDVLAFLKTLAAWQPSIMRHFFTRLRDLFLFTFNIVFRQRMANANMASPPDSVVAPRQAPAPRKRQMINLKTKEECRLGNETIAVWTVELPRKHAEGVLRYATRIHSLTC